MDGMNPLQYLAVVLIPLSWNTIVALFVIHVRHVFAAEKVAADGGIAPFDVAAQVGQQRLLDVGTVMLVFQHL